MVYDLIIAGGSIAGASLAKRVAETGARVLVVEREERFRDRVRGEALQPWGVDEARKLGIEGLLRTCAVELKWFEQSMSGSVAFRRDLTTTTLPGCPMLGFNHCQAQESLLAAAEKAGAEVRRGASINKIFPGEQPQVFGSQAGSTFLETARLVALCSGRNPAMRAELGFGKQSSSNALLLGGVLLTNLPGNLEQSVAYVSNDVVNGTVTALFPQQAGNARAYFGYYPETCVRLQGDSDFPRFLELCKRTAGDVIPFGDAKPGGPLASFDCADVWVDDPYRDGVAVLGDAASSNDPCWGQGLSLALRDARMLAEELATDAAPTDAARAYAQRHDHGYGVIRTVTGWYHQLFQQRGPAADSRRQRALPAIAEDPQRPPDQLFSGPDLPLLPNARERFFAEDTTRAASSFN